MKKIIETIMARGHPQITARHPTTLMITKDHEVGPRGDCIVAMAASKSASELNNELKQMIRSGAAILIKIKADNIVEKIHAFGHPLLTLEHPTDIVVRKSKFICERTLAISADKAAANLSKEFVNKLRDSTVVTVTIETTSS